MIYNNYNILTNTIFSYTTLPLDLSYCEIQTRGFCRLLHGIRIANLSGITTLRMGGNELTPNAIGKCMCVCVCVVIIIMMMILILLLLLLPLLVLLQQMMNLTIFENLSYFDFRNNELGDKGAELICNMALMDQLENAIEIRLDNNLITDEGFKAIVTVFSAIRDEKTPRLKLISVARNRVR